MARAPDAEGYLRLIRALQAKCADFSWQRAPLLGERAPILFAALDVLLSYLERAATCFGGCRGKGAPPGVFGGQGQALA